MKLLTLNVQSELHVGIRTSDGIVDLTLASEEHPEYAGELAGSLTSMELLIESMDHALPQLIDFMNTLEDQGLLMKYTAAEEEVRFGPCLPHPGKIICVGLNYRKHAEETGSPIPEYPILFNKFGNSITSHLQPVAIPETARQVDYEAELAMVIGKTASNVPKEQALEYIFGYCNANDVSARDLQLRTSQWMLGKTCDGFCPIGPYLVTADEVPNPNALEIACYVNDERRQHSNTSDMIYACDEIISYVSRHMTLEPGDIILTGTPEGVVMGYPAERQVYLKPGDLVEIEIEQLGRLSNRFE